VTSNITPLDPEPNDVGGLTDAQLQALFDKFGVDFVAWFNATHIPELPVVTEGVWTPTIGATVADGTHTYAAQVGKYYKIGDLVTVYGNVYLSAKDAAMSGDVRIRGLPFVNDTGVQIAVTISYVSQVTIAAGKFLAGLISTSEDSIRIYLAGSAASPSALGSAAIANSSQIIVFATYKAA
jgi:hypothetical protein